MLIIRFQRVGRKNDPAFRVVVTEKRSKPHSGGVEALGSYHPKTKQTILKNERISYWISKGAQVSPTVHNLLISQGVIKGKKIAKVKVGLVGSGASTEVKSFAEVAETEPIAEAPAAAEVALTV